LDLPSQIDPDRVNATLSDGILEIKLLKVGMGKKIPVLAKAAAA
jgi:HSP20 family molecular chaperone IbpA